jgi:hypothetical protein
MNENFECTPVQISVRGITMKIRYEILAILLINIYLTPQLSYGSCGSAVCPLDHHRYLGGGWLNIQYAYEYINQEQIYIDSQRSIVGAIPHHHDEVQTINYRSVVTVQAGLTNRLGLAVELPFINREHHHIVNNGHSHDGSLHNVHLQNGDSHNGDDHTNGSEWESWNFSGLGDVVVSGSYSLSLPDRMGYGLYLNIQAGLKLPTGMTDARNASGTLGEITIQPGTGSYDLVAGVSYRQVLLGLPTLDGTYTAMPISATVTYQHNGKGVDDYRFGDVVQVHLGTGYFFLERAGLLLQINGRFQDYADVGRTPEPRENTGGRRVFMSPGFQLNVSSTVETFAFVQIPIYRHYNGIQQAAPFHLQLGVRAHVSLL